MIGRRSLLFGVLSLAFPAVFLQQAFADGAIGDPTLGRSFAAVEITPMAGFGSLTPSVGLRTSGGLGGYGILGLSIENISGTISGSVLWRVKNNTQTSVSAYPTVDIEARGQGALLASTATISLLGETASGSGGAAYISTKTTTFAVVSLAPGRKIEKTGTFSLSLQ